MGSEAEDLNYGLYKDAPKTLKPPLKWAGGKRWLVPHLRALYSNSKKQRLVEPFVGGMAVTLGLHPKTALLNDVNPHLINFYQTLKKKLKFPSHWLHKGLSLK